MYVYTTAEDSVEFTTRVFALSLVSSECLRHASTSLPYRGRSVSGTRQSSAGTRQACVEHKSGVCLTRSFYPDDSLNESRYISVFHSQKATLVPFVSRRFTLRFSSRRSLSAKQAVGISDPGISSQISLNSQHTSRVQHQSSGLCVSAK
jgi:hypothetical protein